MTLRAGSKRERLEDGAHLNYRENVELWIEGVSEVRLQDRHPEASAEWLTYAVPDPANLLKSCEIQGKPGEYALQIEDRTIELSLGLAHFTPAQVTEMVDFLHEQEYRLDIKARGTQTTTILSALHDDIRGFAERWNALDAAVTAIVRQPAEHLEAEVREVAAMVRQKHTAGTLSLNLRHGRIGSEGEILSERLYAVADHASLDVPENTHVVAVVQAYEGRLDVLVRRCERSVQRLELELRREQSYGAAETKLNDLQQRKQSVDELLNVLVELTPLPLPAAWRHFRQAPSSTTNRARFDERYAQVVLLELQLDQQRPSTRPHNALELLQECGRRATWELYEYWLTAKVCELLENLDFSSPGGFKALENWQGAAFGLAENRSVVYEHPSGLKIRLTVERHTPYTDDRGRIKTLKPDIVLELVDQDDSVPLILDAKYKNYTAGNRSLKTDLEKSARRYGRAMNGGMGFLIHPGNKGRTPWQYWSAKGPAQPPGVSEDRDFPHRHGVLGVMPAGEGDGDDRGLQRLLTAWLVRHGIFWVCFRCGDDLSRHEARELFIRNGTVSVVNRIGQRQGQLQNKGYRCPCCGMTAVISFCSECNTAGTHSRMFKHYPNLEEGQDIRFTASAAAWAEQMEIFQPVAEKARYYVRHCATCGSDHIPGERRP